MAFTFRAILLSDTSVWGSCITHHMIKWIKRHNKWVLDFLYTAEQQCELPSNEAGIIWDSICFAFLLLQRRVFMSYYFLHVVADIRASQILASRCKHFQWRRVPAESRTTQNVVCLIDFWFSLWLWPLRLRGAELFQATIVKAVRARLEEERKSVEQLKRQWDVFRLLTLLLLYFVVQSSDHRCENGTIHAGLRLVLSWAFKWSEDYMCMCMNN